MAVRMDARSSNRLVFSKFQLDLDDEVLLDGEMVIKLQPRVYTLLRYLLEHPQRLITKTELLDALWHQTSVSDAVLKTYLNQVRRALGDDARAPRFIQTVHGRGYRFIASVKPRSATPGPPQDSERSPATIFVGRESEFDSLVACFGRALSGQRQIVMVTGEAGIGKTSLVSTFLRSEGRAGRRVARGQCVAHHGAGEPYLPVLEALSSLCRSTVGRELAIVLQQSAPSWIEQMPGISTPMPGPAPAARRPTPERMLREMGAAIPRLTQGQPLLLLLEDLHWADISTLQLIDYLARGLEPARFMLIGTYRPQELCATQHPLRALERGLKTHNQCRELALQFLSERDVTTFLSERLGRHDLPVNFAPLIRSHTAGNPLFMVRVVDDLISRGVLREIHGRWRLDGHLDTVSKSVPESVLALMERELDRLEPRALRLIECASVVGVEFSSSAVAVGMADSAAPIEDTLLRWSREGRFIKVAGTDPHGDGSVSLRCAFLHALYQQVVYDRISPTRQADLHRRIGAWATGPGEHEHFSAASLARHFEKARDNRGALRYRRLAGEEALTRSAYSEAIVHLNAALALNAREPGSSERLQTELDLLLAIAFPYTMTRGYTAPETEQAYARALELCRQLTAVEDASAATAGLATFHIVHGGYREARDAGEALLAAARAQQDVAAEVEAHLIIGLAEFYLGNFVRATALLDKTLQLYAPGRSNRRRLEYRQDARVSAQCFLAWICWHFGDSKRAFDQVGEAEEFARQLAEPFSICCAKNYQVMLHLFDADWRAAQGAARALEALSSEHGFAFSRSTAVMAQALVEIETGNARDGLQALQQAWHARSVEGSNVNASFWLVALARGHAKTGQTEEAFVALARAHDVVRGQGEVFWEPEVYRVYGELLLTTAPQHGSAARAVFNRPVNGDEALGEAIARATALGSRALALRAAQCLERNGSSGA